MPGKFHLESSTRWDNLAKLLNFKFKERIMRTSKQKIQVTYKSRNNQVGLGLDQGPSDIQFQKMERQHIFTSEGQNVKPKPIVLPGNRLGVLINSVGQWAIPLGDKVKCLFHIIPKKETLEGLQNKMLRKNYKNTRSYFYNFGMLMVFLNNTQKKKIPLKT